MRPTLLDLFCGFGGATKGFKKAGWDCWGVDIWDECEKHYPEHFVLADVKKVAEDPEAYFPAMKFDFLWASPPCQEYSVSSQPFKRSRAKFNLENPPDPSLWFAALEIQKKLGVPMILENVQGAQKFRGRATWHYGSYYFWGEMPAIMPIPFLKENGIWSHRKGFSRVRNKNLNPSDSYGAFGGNAEGCKTGKVFVGEYDRANWPKGKEFSNQRSGKKRQIWSAKVAMIPEELSEWLGKCFYPREVVAR